MKKRRLTFSIVILCILLSSLTAQTTFQRTAREEILDNIYLSGSNFVDYQRQFTTEKLTKAPKGYEPYYISHYGRHGSRWLCNNKEYLTPLEKLRKAHAQGKLTQEGEAFLQRFEAFYLTVTQRAGDLTTVGEFQHHGIGKRLTQNFPEIFGKKNVKVDARSTKVVRCILSMTAECEELASYNPSIRFHNDASDSIKFYLDQRWSKRLSDASSKGDSIRSHYRNEWIRPERLTKVLFNDPAYVRDSLNAQTLMRELFAIASNMQSHYTRTEFYSLFTKEEIYDLWRYENLVWYLGYSHAPATDGIMAFSQQNLLKNIIATADTITQTQATLRFGHEVCVMPLACLLELGFCGVRTTDYAHIDNYWRNYRIFPMGSNIQLIFYRPKKGKKGEILVKALLNEREMTLPIPSTQHPYYPWKELRNYYLQKLEAFEK